MKEAMEASMAEGLNWVLTNELHQRIDSIGARASRAATSDLAADLDAIRRLAMANGLTPAVCIVHALESALASGQRGPMITDGLSLLRDAVACGRTDSRTGAAFAAACSIRLAS
ncbi:hypothetical protein K9B35_06575 [Sphingomonas sp. R647]|uniref:hypothetical protein n=1 Tax=Sphingomonas sp. R647 TaxID=2875233 RepID=UPI001CD73C15|nr:hypothetical protein [Sphingomonas sp. R647]MCA1197623.1 hypothetical protein [Sphingomonas sp. R647]